MITWMLACTRWIEPSPVARQPERVEAGTWTAQKILDRVPVSERIDWSQDIGFDLIDDEPLFGFGMTDLVGTSSANWIQGWVYRITDHGLTTPIHVNGTRFVDVAAAPDGRVCATYWGSDRLEVYCDGAVAQSFSQPASTPNLAFDAAGGMHLAWRAATAPHVTTYRYRDPAGVVTDVTTVSDPSSTEWQAFDFAVSPDGTPYLALMAPQPTLWSRAADGTWESTDLVDVALDREQISVAVSESGSVAVAWGSNTADGDSVSFWRDGELEHPFVYPRDVFHLNHPRLCPSVAFGPGDVPYLGWTDNVYVPTHYDSEIRVATPDADVQGGWASEVIDDPSPSAYDDPQQDDCTSGLLLRTQSDGTPEIAAMTSGEQLWWYRRSGPMVEPPPPPPPPPATRTVGDLQPGDLVITEIMANPSAVSDSVGEWIELHNPGSSAIDPDGLEIVDASGSVGTVDGEGEVPAGGYAIVGRSDPAWFVAAAAEVGTWGSGPALNNTGDTVRIEGPHGAIDAADPYPSAGGAAGAGVAARRGRPVVRGRDPARGR